MGTYYNTNADDTTRPTATDDNPLVFCITNGTAIANVVRAATNSTMVMTSLLDSFSKATIAINKAIKEINTFSIADLIYESKEQDKAYARERRIYSNYLLSFLKDYYYFPIKTGPPRKVIFPRKQFMQLKTFKNLRF